MKKKIHLVAFDNPYPPNYGGTIDIYYKIKALFELNVEISLHIYASKNTSSHKELEKYCSSIFYYDRNEKIVSHFSFLPYRIKSRSDKKLLNNLNIDNVPIIYEGLHSCYTLPKIKNRKTYVRAHNVEHKYLYELAKSEKKTLQKTAFYIEAFKLQYFEKHLKKVSGIFTISPLEQKYFKNSFGEKSFYIPAFHDIEKNQYKKDTSTEPFVLYHGNLNVAENNNAALYLISTYKETAIKLVIASSSKNPLVLKEIKKYSNIYFEDIPTQESLNKLFAKAHINVLITFQNTGIKLKLLNALYKGNFVLTNKEMAEETDLEELCVVANSKKEILQKTKQLFSKKLTDDQIIKRQEILKTIAPSTSAKKMIDIIFK